MHDADRRPTFPSLIFLELFFLSGLAGLIYESIWSQYLGLFLGNSAFSQSVVLVIYMGGMALGSWLAGRFTGRIKRLLLGYALTEALIGLWAVLFHPLFAGLTGFSLQSLFPHLTSPFITATKWVVALLLLVPPTLLLGATFPLISIGMVRRFQRPAGRTISQLYFVNSLGASIGVILCGFLLTPRLGLPGTVLAAGILNVAIGAAAFLLAFRKKAAAAVDAAAVPPLAERGPGVRALYLAAGLTGFAAFLYEIAWIRMLGIVLGNTAHSFELMLSAFILGLAIGGLWIRNRLDAMRRPFLFLGIAQLLMGAFAALTMPFYGRISAFVPALVNGLAKNDLGYALFSISSHLVSLAVMLPATICSGMIFPLATRLLLSTKQAERAVGNAYAANTFGAICGVLLGFHLIMPLLGLEVVILIGVLGNMALGCWFLLRYRARASLPARIIAAAVAVGLVALTIPSWRLDFTRQAGMAYQGQVAGPKLENLFHEDGKTATVNLVRYPDGSEGITINGRVEGLVHEGSVTVSDGHNIMAAAVPYALSSSIESAAVIGMGSGMTTEALLANPNVKRVDTIEIERAVVSGAKLFGPEMDRTFHDPRSHLYVDDAKTFFVNENRRYDLIVSFPSQPWVSGVAGLFSDEFYGLVARYITSGGYLVQWITLYEMDPELIASIVKALRAHFPHYALYFSDDQNLTLVASRSPIPVAVSNDVFAFPYLRERLGRLGIRNLDDLQARRLGSDPMLDAWFDSFKIAANSDFHPVLEYGAAKAMFLRHVALGFHALLNAPYPLGEILEERPPQRAGGRSPQPFYTASGNAGQAEALLRTLTALPPGAAASTDSLSSENKQLVRDLASSLYGSPFAWTAAESEQLQLDTLQELAFRVLPYLTPSELESLWAALTRAPRYSALPGSARSWVALYEALGRRDMLQVVTLSRSLLPDGPIPDVTRNRFLLSAAVLGMLALGENNDALSLLRRFSWSDAPSTDLQVLIANLARRLKSPGG